MSLEFDFVKTKMTPFLCQELLYEYATHRLDKQKEKQIAEFLREDRESAREFENLNKGLRYVQIAAKVEISSELYEALEKFEPQWKKRLRAWTLWSSERGWKMLPYAFAVIAIGLGLFLTKPWKHGEDKDILLTEMSKFNPEVDPLPSAPVNTDIQYDPMELIMTDMIPEPAIEETDVPHFLAQREPPKKSSILLPSIAPMPAPLPTPAATPASTESTEVARAQASSAEQIGRGFLYRAEMQVTDFHNSWPAIRDKIVALGGRIAGNVELGWLRRPNEAYFHFTLPESNYNELQIFLNTFSPVRFSKDRHPRVMPEGEIRIILTVKDGMTENEGSTEAP